MNKEQIIACHHKFYMRNYFLCEDETEREFIIQLLLVMFPRNSHEEVDCALGYACRTVRDKCNLKLVLECAMENIGKV